MPIKALNPYQGRWTVKARCTHKGDVRAYNNARGGGRMFSFDLLDRGGGEIRVTAWNDQVDAFFPVVRQGGVYLLSKGSLKPKNARFNTTPHDFEIFLERGSTLVEVDAGADADAAAIPRAQYNFVKIADLERAAAGAVVDVVGVVHAVAPAARITRRDGTDTDKRSVHIRDDSGASVELTLWDKFVADPGAAIEGAVGAEGRFPVLAAKGVRVGDFNGKNLSTVNATGLTLDPPDLEEARRLRSWCARVCVCFACCGCGGLLLRVLCVVCMRVFLLREFSAVDDCGSILPTNHPRQPPSTNKPLSPPPPHLNHHHHHYNTTHTKHNTNHATGLTTRAARRRPPRRSAAPAAAAAAGAPTAARASS